MRPLLLASLMALAACTLDPDAVVAQADLTVEVNGAKDLGATSLKVEARGASGQTVTKETTQLAEPTVLVFERGTLGAGEVTLTVEASDGAGVRGCDGFTDTIAAGAHLARTLQDTQTSAAHCGACFHSCDAAQGDRACTAGVCGTLTCAAGYSDPNGKPEDGCEKPTGCMPVFEGDEASCANGVDDDCDGKADCDDPDCQGMKRSCAVASCAGVQTWDCAAKSWTACTVDAHAESTPELCEDGLDNDCDGKTDCDDPDCNQTQLTCSPAGTQCIGVQLWDCHTHLLNTCRLLLQAPEADPKTCADGVDNDCDGKVDCADLGCLGQACREGSTCCVKGLCVACR